VKIPFGPSLIGTVPLHAAPVAIVLFALTVPIALRLANREGRPWLVPLVLGSLALHLLGAVLQVLVVRAFYGNVADFQGYDGQGALLAKAWHAGVWTLPPHVPGNGTVSVIVGAVYGIIGVDQLSGFFVFSWFSLMGLVAFYRAFRIALPDARCGRYAALIFLLPSLWYWPTAVGKESVMLVALGLMALGAAYLLRSRWWGLVPFAAGSFLGAVVRPHEVALVFGAFGVAVVTRRLKTRSLLTPLRIGVTLLIVVGVGALLAVVTARSLGITSLTPTAVVRAVNGANDNLQGNGGNGTGSSHDTWNASPLYYPVDVYTVLFMPLPFQVGSATQAIAALENLSIIALIVSCRRSLTNVGTYLRQSPFVVMCLIYSLGFLYLFAALGNVGLLARERTLLFPFLFVLFALPDRRSPRRRGADALRRDEHVSSREPTLL
jgi:hypothetical protein